MLYNKYIKNDGMIKMNEWAHLRSINIATSQQAIQSTGNVSKNSILFLIIHRWTAGGPTRTKLQ